MGTTRTRNRREKDTISTSSLSTLVLLIVFNVCQLSRGNPVFVDNPSLAQFQSGRNIRHLPCIVRKSGLSGVCMFAIDCIKQNGTHLGTCIDRFYFGSCCQMKPDTPIFAEDISDNSIDQNTISHFSHESSTLSTSSIFKISTEGTIDSVGFRNHSTIHPYIPVSTITHMAPKVESTTMRYITSRRTTTTTTTKAPTTTTSTTTTTTTPAPTSTRNPPRRKTTTPAPILTTSSNSGSENDFESTTLPSKFTTFQMVETSTPNRPTDPTIAEDVQYTTTVKTPTYSQRPSTEAPRTKKPIITKIPAANFTASPSTTSRPSTRTTPKYKPTLVKRPTTTKKPFQTKRPITTTTTPRTKYTRKPVTHHDASSSTPSPTRNDPSPSTSSKKTTVLLDEPTTRAPRPKPKPTSEIFKISLPTVATETTTLSPKTTTTTSHPTTSTVLSTTTTVKPVSISSTASKPASSTTTRTPVSTTTVPTTTASTTTTTTTTEKITTTARPTTSTTTTQKHTTVESLPEPTSTYRPTLVTWITIDDNRLNNTHTTIEETDWQPKPPPADWVPVPTIDPEVAASKNSSAVESTSSPSDSSTEGIKLPSSSETNKTPEVTSSTASTPLSLPENVSMSSAGTPGIITSTTSKPVTTSATSTTPSSSSTTEPPPKEQSTEIFITEMNTETLPEDFNVTTSMPFTTVSPIPSLEGVDYRQVCGRRMFPEPRIVGGSNAAFGRWPWQISLRQWRTSTYLHKCGAALLNENWAITAAHCVDNVPPSDLLLRLGEYDLAEEEEPYGYQERRVQIVASHPQFDPRTFEYDLALLRFYEPVVFQPNIIPVCVPGSDEDFIGQTAFVTGWGRLYEDGPLPSVLQEVAVPIINNTICETMYRAAGYIEHIPHIFICAGWKKGGYDSCEGDSGGPMVLQRETDKRFMLGGVISWGIGCAEPNQPGVYTRISEFRDWINQILQF